MKPNPIRVVGLGPNLGENHHRDVEWGSVATLWVASRYTSKSLTSRACFSMKSRRGSTWSPINTRKISSAAAASSIVTCNKRRASGFIVVDHNSSESISPRPLNRVIRIPFSPSLRSEGISSLREPRRSSCSSLARRKGKTGSPARGGGWTKSRSLTPKPASWRRASLMARTSWRSVTSRASCGGVGWLSCGGGEAGLAPLAAG